MGTAAHALPAARVLVRRSYGLRSPVCSSLLPQPGARRERPREETPQAGSGLKGVFSVKKYQRRRINIVMHVLLVGARLGFFGASDGSLPCDLKRLLRGGGLCMMMLVCGFAAPARGQGAAPLPEQQSPEQPTLSTPYAIQINASEEAAHIAGQHDSLRQLGLPVYRTQVESEGRVIHRLRVGPFPSRADARSFAACHGFADPWVVPALAGRTASGQVVIDTASDVLPLRPRPPRFLLGQRHPFGALLMPADDPSAQARTTTLRVYGAGRSEPAIVENVSGVREASGTLEYGRAERVFIRSDTSRPADDHEDDIEAFSRAYGLSTYLVEDQLALYDAGRVARFTLLGTLPLPEGEARLHRQPGFDYVDRNGRVVRHRGSVSTTRAQQMGNARALRLRSDGPTQAVTRRAALFARPTEQEHAHVCLLFFAE